MRHGDIVDFQLEENQLVANGCSRRSLTQKVKWRNTKLVSSKRLFPGRGN
jgi:hypothetical protein